MQTFSSVAVELLAAASQVKSKVDSSRTEAKAIQVSVVRILSGCFWIAGRLGLDVEDLVRQAKGSSLTSVNSDN
jgi:hypothetical protein